MKNLLVAFVLLSNVLFVSAQDAAQLINDANEALKAKDYTKAFQLYDQAMKNIGDVQVDQSINFNIGFAAYQADKFQEALSYFDKAIEAGVNVSKCHEYKANAYTKINDYSNAIECYKKAIETSTEDAGSLYFNAAIAAYKGNLLEIAVSMFSEAAKAGYKANDAIYYKAVSLKKLNLDEDYKMTLIEGAEKFPTEKKITSALANIFVSEGNELYKKGVEILNTANKKVNDGAMSTADEAYNKEVEKSKVEFKNAVEILQKALTLEPTNENAQKLIDACKQVI